MSSNSQRYLRLSAKAAIIALVQFLAPVNAADSSGPMPSSALDQAMLAECEGHASAYGEYHHEVQSTIEALDRLGVFAPEEFQSVKIGFCDLRRHGGPVATTSCDKDAILLDEKYEDESSRFAMMSTLAHEMKHVLQHAENKRRYGDAYCSSEQYVKDKDSLERDADAFSVEVEKIAFLGRPVEIENTCPTAVEVYIDGESVRFHESNSDQFTTVLPNSKISANVMSTSKSIQYFAATTLANGGRRYWRGGGEERIIDGVRQQLAPIELESRVRASGSFILRVHCD